MITLLVDAEVFAPEPLGRRSLLIGGGEILWMGEGEPALPPGLGVERIDLGGRRLVPALIDGHAHVTGGGGEAGYGSSVPPQPAGVFAAAGVATVVGVLGTDDCVRTTGQLVNAVHGLRAAGLSAFCHTGGYHYPLTTLTGSAREDIVHVDPIIGIGEFAISDHRSSQPTPDEFRRVASEAHVAGLMTGKAGILHLHLGDGPRGLELVRRAIAETELPARVFQPTHVNRNARLFAEAIELTRSGVVIDVTASPEEGPGVGDDEVPATRAVAAILDGAVDPRRWTVSSDGGGCLPVFDAEGRIAHLDVGRPSTLPALLARLLDAGRPLEAILPGFTRNVADLLRLPRKGRIAVGADADLLALEDGSHGVRDLWARGRRLVAEGRLLVS
ncbi:MAG: amidohydrolase family protein [Planctomycetota bacterium]